MKKSIHLHFLLIGIAAFCFLLYFPIFSNKDAQHAFALFVFIAILWMTEAIPLALTGLIIPVIASFLQLLQPKEAFSQFAHPIIFLFLGGFVLAGALTHHSLDKMLAQRLIGIARGNFYWSSVLLMLATALLSCCVSNTSSTLMMLPLGLGILTVIKKDKVTAESKFLMLGIAYSANIGGIITLIGSPPNAIGAAVLGISFSGWLRYGIPLFLITFPVMVAVLTMYFRPDRKLEVTKAEEQVKGMRSGKLFIFIFIFTIAMWLLESWLAPMVGITDGFSSVVAILAVFLIVIAKVMSWEEVLKCVRWDVLLLFGGGLTLGTLLDSSGLAAMLVAQISGYIDTMPILAFLFIIVFATIMLTEFMSNTASAALFLPILYTLALNIDVVPALLVLPATFAATFAFMLPVGTPPNALIFSSGLVPQKDMIRAGLILNILFAAILSVFFFLIFR
jgi:sodium-dependent dicarboxylate transporter 2/3/5